MSYMIGIDPARVYTEADALAGKCPALGTIGTLQDGRVYVMCKVSTGNVTNGHLVTIDRSHNIASTTNTSNPLTAANRLGVALSHTTTLTASTSQLIWVQLFGPCVVLASLSALPNIVLYPGSVTGAVDDAGSGNSSASSYIGGLILNSTSSLASTLCNAILNYPRFVLVQA